MTDPDIKPEKVDLDALFVLADRSERSDPGCWYDGDPLELDNLFDERFVVATSPRVVLALIARIRELETALGLFAIHVGRFATHESLRAEIAEVEAVLTKGTTR